MNEYRGKFRVYSIWLRVGRPGFDSQHVQDFSPLHRVQTACEAHPASYSMRTGDSFPEVKRLGRDADRSPPSNAELKNGGAIPPLPHMSSWRVA
jgi:hypothetical protein